MANKRSLKKQIRYICGDIAGETLLAKTLIPGIDKAAMTDVIVKTAELQTTALCRTNISFDKAPKDFENKAQYRAARRKYYRQAFGKLSETFNNQVLAVVKEMNAAMPKKK
ncbi:MAG: hypothetical protein K2J66_00330 [Muribaculaceae bacterium]|nr:hypothetical protein [Muribaculaceae bacterium]MDE6755572.1 hypothetical protein [Muribaculaceae bacterium]